MKKRGRTDKEIIRDLTKEVDLLRAGIRGQTTAMLALQQDNKTLTLECERRESDKNRLNIELNNECAALNRERVRTSRLERALTTLCENLPNFKF